MATIFVYIFLGIGVVDPHLDCIGIICPHAGLIFTHGGVNGAVRSILGKKDILVRVVVAKVGNLESFEMII